jgi:signal transduction histidine kinase
MAVAVIYDVTDLDETQTRLRRLNFELEERVAYSTETLRGRNLELGFEVSRRQAMDDALSHSRDELRRLSKQLMKAHEVERRNLARELHDGLGQSVGALKYTLEHSLEMCDRGEHGQAADGLRRCIDQIQQVLRDTRSIAMNLRPSVLDDMGPVSAIEWLCREFEATYRNLSVTAICKVTDREVPSHIAPHLFRIVQESLNNVAKHARAKTALVTIGRKDNSLMLSIRDDGIGIEPERLAQAAGAGIAGMRERAEITNGRFDMRSTADDGTEIRVTWRLTPAAFLEGR